MTDDDRERRALTEVEEILDLEDDARAAALRRLEREDADLAAVVRGLLERNADAATWLPTESPGLWAIEEDRIPDRIGPFAVAGIIGKGGMGTVLKGVRDDGMFSQTVAIKLMRVGLLSIHQQERFILERQILARLDSPAVCRILDGGVWEGRPFLVMEYVDGLPITTAADRQGMDLAARLRLFLGVCEAVRDAHRQLIVHADLKPSNIMVNATGQVKLLDFGIARLIDDEADLQGEETTGRGLSLTRAYAAPERRAGERPSIVSDVFSLGAILFELVTGKIGAPVEHDPADGPDDDWPRASDVADGSGVDPAALRGDIDAIIAKAVAPDAADRYPDTTALIADIEAWFADYPVSARPVGWRTRTTKFIARHRRGLAITAAAVVLLAGAAIFSVVQAVRADRARQVAERRFNDVRALSNYMLFDLYDKLAARPGTVARRAELAATSVRYLAGLQVSEDSPVDLRLDVARSYRRLSEIQGYPGMSNIGQPELALKSLDSAEAILTTIRPDQPGYGDAQAELGWVLEDRWTLLPDSNGGAAKLASAKHAFQQALARAPDDKLALLGLLSIAHAEAYDLIWSFDRPADAIPLLNTTLAKLRAMRWPEAMTLRRDMLEIALLNNLGDATYYAGDMPGSLAPYRTADAIIDRNIAAHGETPSLLMAKALEAFNISGTLADGSKRYTEALDIARAGAASMERLIAAGPDASAEKLLLILYGQEATVLENMDRLQDAFVPLAKGAAIRERRLAMHPNEPHYVRDSAIGLQQLARVYGKGHRDREACVAATRGMGLWTQLQARGQISKHDAGKEVPQMQALADRYCPRK